MREKVKVKVYSPDKKTFKLLYGELVGSTKHGLIKVMLEDRIKLFSPRAVYPDL